MKKAISNILSAALNSALMLAAALAPSNLSAQCLILPCGPNKAVACDAEWNFDPPGVVPSPECGCFVTVLSTVTNGNCLQYNISRTWAITNVCGEYHSCAQTVSVVNTNQPVFYGATNIDLYSCGSTQVFFSVTATESCCGSLPVTCGPPSGYSFPPGPTLVGCSTRDCCGRTFNTTFEVYVHPTGGIAAYCADKYVAFGDTNWTFDPPSVSDDCCPGNYTFVPQTPITNQASGPMIITEVWGVTDGCSQGTYCTETVYVTNTPPVTYDISWHKVAGGGGGSGTGGAYAVSGTAGQWDAGRMSGVNLTLDGGFWALFGGASSNSFSGLGFCSNQITGTLQFSNSSSNVLNLLYPPGDEGIRECFIYTDSLPPGRQGNSGYQPIATRAGGGYSVTVDTDCTNAAGVAYVVSPIVFVGSDGEEYYNFNAKTSAPVVVGMAGPVLNFEECVGVVQFNFVDTQGSPVSVSDGSIIGDSYQAFLFHIPAGSTQRRFYLRGGGEHTLQISVSRGADPYTDSQTQFLVTNLTVACDAIVNVNVVFPSIGSYGQITGTVDMLREFEWTIHESNNRPDMTSVVANNGPFGNQRWAAVRGDNATVPSSGTFNLINVVPSVTDPSSLGYSVQAQMLIRSNRMAEAFWTPALGYGSNPPVSVPAGVTVDLGNMFQIDPGYARGALRLQGPAEPLGHLSMLRGLRHMGDDDANHDGIPDQLSSYYYYYWSTVGYGGVDRLAAGAQYTAANGGGHGDFDGSFDASSSSYLGRYELALGGLQGERSLWRPSELDLELDSPTWTDSVEDYSETCDIIHRTSPAVEVVPNQAVNNDLAYGFSEIIVRMYSPSASFSKPVVWFTGGLTGSNFLGQAVDYYVPNAGGIAYGTPYYYETNRGQVRVLLPEGSYTLRPSVESGGNQVGLSEIDLTVGAGQRLDLGNCLRLDLTIPTHTSSSLLTLSGAVLTGCNNNVLDVSYELNGGAPVTICNNCGANPALSFSVPLVDGANNLSVTAHDDQGATTSINGTIQLEVPPPSLTIFLTSSNTVFIAWPAPSTGFRLVQSSDLGAGNWSTAPDLITDNGTIRFIVVNPPAGNRFYRLVKP